MTYKSLRVALVAVLLLGLGYAGADSATRNWNLKQKTDGTTVLRENSPGTANEIRVDRHIVTLAFEDIGSAVTRHVVVPNLGNSGTYYVSKVWSVTHEATDAEVILTCGVGTGESGQDGGSGEGYNFTAATITHTVAASAAGATQSLTPTATNSVAAGGLLFCGSDGGGTTTRATITFQLDGNF